MNKKWWHKYIGIPFHDHGRDLMACDCYGLLRVIYYAELGIHLPLLRDEYDSTANRMSIARLVNDQPLVMGFKKVGLDDVAPFDALIIQQMESKCHIGIVTQPGRMIHTERGKNSCVEDYSRPHIFPRVKEAWRYERA